MKLLTGSQSYGSHGSRTIRIEIETSAGIEENPSEALLDAGYEAEKIIAKALGRELIKADPKSAIATKRNSDGIRGCFEHIIYVKEIPNGYCSDYCCEHLPWFIVTTKIGPIKIGWRKRVIEIDWSETSRPDASTLFGDEEDTTKEGHMIHAWGYDKAKEYLKKIIDS